MMSFHIHHLLETNSPRTKKVRKTLPVCVRTLDADCLHFDIPFKWTGRNLFDLVCRTLGLREIWYFGLQYTDSEGFVSWLKFDKKVTRQNIGSESPASFLFLVKFFPVDVIRDTFEEATLHFFFLQAKQAILNMNVHCTPELCVLLASYKLQAKFGDLDESSCQSDIIANEDLLPQNIIDQFLLTSDMWVDRIKKLYADHQGMTTEEAETEYLKVVQGLGMSGVNYFSVSDKEKRKFWLGITSSGINIYDQNDKLCPTVCFEWKDIRKVSFRRRKFVVALLERHLLPLEFRSSSVKINELIFELCIGNHEIFKRKQKPESMEVQQMKVKSREKIEKQQIERSKMTMEKQAREAAEKKTAMLKKELHQCQEEVINLTHALHRCELLVELLAEKAQVTAEETELLEQKILEVQAESHRAKLSAVSSEIAKNKKPIIKELIMGKDSKECKTPQDVMIAELGNEKGNFDNLNSTPVRNVDLTTSLAKQHGDPLNLMHCGNYWNVDSFAHNEIKMLKMENLKEKCAYNKMSAKFVKQLHELKSELEVLKNEERSNV